MTFTLIFPTQQNGQKFKEKVEANKHTQICDLHNFA